MKNLLKKTISIGALAIFQSCSSNLPEPVDKLKQYTLENKILYQTFKELLEKKGYLSSKDRKTHAWKDPEKNCAMIKKIFDERTTLTFKDYDFDGFKKNDEYVENFTLKHLGNLNLEGQLSLAKSYTWEIESLIKDNQDKP